MDRREMELDQVFMAVIRWVKKRKPVLGAPRDVQGPQEPRFPVTVDTFSRALYIQLQG